VYGPKFPKTAKTSVPVILHVVTPHGFRYISALFPGLIESWQLRNFVKAIDDRARFDVVEGLNDEGWHFFVARTFGRRYWMRLHSSLRQHFESKKQPMTWSRRFAVWLDGAAARRANHLVTHSRVHASEMAREYGIQMDHIHIVPHAIEEPVALPNPPYLDINNNPVIAYIGTLDQRKGIDIFLQAIPEVVAKFPKSRFMVIGRDGGDSLERSWKDWFVKTYPDKSVQQAATFTGSISDEELAKLWNQFSMVAVPSRYESFGYVVVEAFARRIPAIVSTGGALPEVAKDGALVVDVADPHALANGIIRLLSDPTLSTKLARRGRELYEQHYTMEQLANNVLRLYTQTA
jgi:glycosyltransferase involved in cell wall biosynthesis